MTAQEHHLTLKAVTEWREERGESKANYASLHKRQKMSGEKKVGIACEMCRIYLLYQYMFLYQ